MTYRRHGGVLFGPVVPGAFRAEGQSAELMYLSIVRPVEDEAPPAIRLPRGRIELNGDLEGLREQIEEALERARPLGGGNAP